MAVSKEYIIDLINHLGFVKESKSKYSKIFGLFDAVITVDFDKEEIIYPESNGFKVNERQTCNFSDEENFVVLDCVVKLLDKGYRPEHIELERKWSLGHEQKSGRADVCVSDENGNTLFIVECKTFGKEYQKEYTNITTDGGQLFSYWQQERSCNWLVLYASKINADKAERQIDSICCIDDSNIVELAKKDENIGLFSNANTAEDLFSVWDETYEKRFCGDVVFRDDSIAYKIGVKPLRKKDLCDFSENDKIVNKFEEILRHNNVSDKENAFNRLVALFICKLVDEIQKSDEDIVEFQYKVGTDTYETLQDRLQRLHKDGMEKFMREKIFYIPDTYADDLVQQYTGHKRQNMIEDLKSTLRILKFYTNNDFAFKDVHNEELFYQNGKILVEVVQLFEKFRIIGSNDLQFLGDLFEQLLNKGFKQNEGQFFTPMPITKFIWDSLPVEKFIDKGERIEYPKIIDYACGAGHFLTQGFETINEYTKNLFGSEMQNKNWVENCLFGIEKDYRLARVSKISLFMHGAGDGNIVFGDGLENYEEKNIVSKSFDILVANPPYSVSAFKPHLKLKNNSFETLDKISNNGSEIETLFVERMAQLVKPGGVAAVILPSSILNKDNESFISAREFILKNFFVRSIAQFGGKTFGATGTNTVILFLEKFSEPPKRLDLVKDSVQAIFESRDISEWEDQEIFFGYITRINVSEEDYMNFVEKKMDFDFWQDHSYFGDYFSVFVGMAEVIKKRKQSSFLKLSPEEQYEWLNRKFYEYVLKIEQEKMEFFALCYQQKTLIITAPDDNKEQETFLGYKWSNRKGNEGIQIITPGGMLYSVDGCNDTKIAGMIKKSFIAAECDISGLEKYYYYLRLQDMLDFTKTSFNKVIKTTPIRNVKAKPGMSLMKLNNDCFEVFIGDRVLSSEIVDDGATPVYSANVFVEFGRINKTNITDFSIPSIVWGIDGDWMVNTIPSGKPFYPTDHCGVLRIHNDNVYIHYLAIALMVEGEFERFSRTNRASSARIKDIVVQMPDKDTQIKIADAILKIRDEITERKKKIDYIANQQIEKFNEQFLSTTSMIAIGAIADVERGTTITREQTINGPIPVVAGGVNPSCYHNVSNREGNIITISASGANAGYVNYWNIPIFASDCNSVKSQDENAFATKFIYYALLSKQSDVFSLQVGSGQPHVYADDIKGLKIPNVSSIEQRKFLECITELEKQKDIATQELLDLIQKENNEIDKHFRN